MKKKGTCLLCFCHILRWWFKKKKALIVSSCVSLHIVSHTVGFYDCCIYRVRKPLNAFSHSRWSETQQMQTALCYTINSRFRASPPPWHSLMETWWKQRQIQTHGTQRRSLILVLRIHENVSLLQFSDIILFFTPIAQCSHFHSL